MSRTFSLIVLCPNGRRETIKITPNNSILQVLEEACSKQHLKPEDFDICHYNKSLDLSLPIRFANLPNNALLELRPAKNVRKESLVTVGLQLESGERFMEDFPPSSSISDVIEKYLRSRTDTDNLQEKGEAVCIYMRQTLSGDALKTTSLRSLGLTEGKAIIRLLYRKPEELEHQAHISTPLTKSSKVESVFISDEQNISNEQVRKQPRLSNTEIRYSDVCNDVENNLNSIGSEQNYYASKEDPIDLDHNVGKEMDVENVHEQKAPAVQEKDSSGDLNSESQLSSQNMEVDDVTVCEDESSSVSVDDIKYIGERHAVLYSLDHITDVKKADLPDEFFELTIDDVKYLLAEYKRNRDELENQPLLTKEQRQRQSVQKLAYYHQAVIRVYFPEKLVLQAVFMVDEKVQVISDFVRNFLENKDLNFYLYITPPKEKLSLSKTILESMLVPAAVIYFGCEVQQSNYLDKSLMNKLSDPRAASLAASEARKQSFSNVPIADISGNIDDPAVSENASENFPSTTAVLQQNVKREEKKIPKWLKLSK